MCWTNMNFVHFRCNQYRRQHCFGIQFANLFGGCDANHWPGERCIGFRWNHIQGPVYGSIGNVATENLFGKCIASAKTLNKFSGHNRRFSFSTLNVRPIHVFIRIKKSNIVHRWFAAKYTSYGPKVTELRAELSPRIPKSCSGAVHPWFIYSYRCHRWEERFNIIIVPFLTLTECTICSLQPYETYAK